MWGSGSGKRSTGSRRLPVHKFVSRATPTLGMVIRDQRGVVCMPLVHLNVEGHLHRISITSLLHGVPPQLVCAHFFVLLPEVPLSLRRSTVAVQSPLQYHFLASCSPVGMLRNIGHNGSA